MNRTQRVCFVMMPYVPELHYFYLYLKKHIEESFPISCARADDQVLTKPIIDKINDYIRNADVIISDCSGRNPNVFYELGIAHAHGKKVILITKDPVSEAPSDVRHYEFIYYDLSKHTEFLKKLNNALSNIFVEKYEELYKIAVEKFNEFRNTTKTYDAVMASKEEFIKRVMVAERTRDLPSLDDEWALKEFLLPRIVENSYDFGIMENITKWISGKVS